VANVGPMVTAVNVIGGQATTRNPLSLDANFSDPAGTADAPFSFQWQATNPAGSTVAASTSATFTFTPDVLGTYSISVAVADKDGGHGTFTRSVEVQPPSLGPPQPFSAGADAGSSPRVLKINPDGTLAGDFLAFEPDFAGGVRVATADMNGDGIPDQIAGSGPGRVAEVRVFDGKTGQPFKSISPFESFTGGVFVSTGDLNGDGKPDLVITPDQGGGPRVEIFRGGDGDQIANFFGIDDPNFRGGARAGLGDIDGDGFADLVISAGFGGGPRLSIYEGAALAQGRFVHPVPDFFLFEPALRNGAYVQVGDLNGDGLADVIGGAGPGGAPRVFVLSGRELLNGGIATALNAPIANFFAGNTANRGGVRVAVANLDGDNRADLLVGDGEGGGSRVTAFLGKDFVGGAVPDLYEFDAFAGFTGGVFVG